MTTKVMSPAEMRAERVDALQQEIDTEVVNLTARLRASADFRAETRAKALVIEKVADLMRAAKWCCLVEKGGARDNGATWGLTVSAEPIRCPACDGRGSFTDERGLCDKPSRCSRCDGSGRVK